MTAAVLLTERDADTSGKKKVECDVTITNNLLGSAQSITSASCDNVGRCGFFSIANAGAYSIFGGDKGTVRLLDGTKVIDKKAFKIPLFGRSDTVSLSGCTAANVITIKLSDEDDNFQDSMNVNV